MTIVFDHEHARVNNPAFTQYFETLVSGVARAESQQVEDAARLHLEYLERIGPIETVVPFEHTGGETVQAAIDSLTRRLTPFVPRVEEKIGFFKLDSSYYNARTAKGRARRS